jgi:hypothetical protein
MSNSNYGYSKKVNVDFYQAIESIKEELKNVG